eukprot:7082003-Prymnesium_polylepis.1
MGSHGVAWGRMGSHGIDLVGLKGQAGEEEASEPGGKEEGFGAGRRAWHGVAWARLQVVVVAGGRLVDLAHLDRLKHDADARGPVSYTHLTLPTICSV